MSRQTGPMGRINRYGCSTQGFVVSRPLFIDVEMAAMVSRGGRE